MSRTRPAPKVLLVSGAFPHMPCGVGDYTGRLARALAALPGMPGVEVLTSADPWVEIHEPQRDGVRVWPVMPAWGLGQARSLTRIVRMLRPDVVHVQFPSHMGRSDRGALASLIPAYLRALRPRPYLVTTLHEFGERRTRFRLRAYLLLAASDALVFTSEADRAAAGRLPAVRGKSQLVVPIGPNVVPPPGAGNGPGYSREEVRRALGVGPEEVLLVLFGFFLPDKGIEDALAALGELRSRGTPARLLLLGEPSPEARAYAERTMAAHVASLANPSWVVVRAGGRPWRTSALLGAADAGVFPFPKGASARRGSLLAAMAHGLPVVTTRGPRLPPGLVDGENVLLVDPSDRRALACALARLAGDPAERAGMGRAGREWARKPSWDEIARATLEAYGG